jgi:hypothetical protein
MEEPAIKYYANRFEEEMQNNVYNKVFVVKLKNSTSRSSSFGGNQPPPQFQIQKTPFIDLLGKVWLDLVLLILFNILLFAGSVVAFLRYDVR